MATIAKAGLLSKEQPKRNKVKILSHLVQTFSSRWLETSLREFGPSYIIC